ncbi:ribonuclease J [Myxococcota bacterium]
MTLRVVPLGGLGHVGGNMMVYETAEHMIAIDCGVLFPTAEQPGIDYVIPDITYLLDRRHKFRAFVLTHGHEDHIGALPFILPKIDAPIYGTRLTLALLHAKLNEYPSLNPTTVEIHDRAPFEIGDLRVEPIPVTHSIPDAVALAIHTPVGVVVHTGDFKIDAAPLDGRRTDTDVLRTLGDNGVVALFSDSTNAEKSGHTWGEQKVGETLDRLVAQARGHVFVTAFASNLHRLQMIMESSERAGRRVLPVGRSIQQNIQLALERGFIRARFGAVGDATEFDRLPPSRVTVIAGGSQGEPQSAMTRIARGLHGQVRVDPDDLVILSSRRIPGNERPIGNMINNLFKLGARVVDDRVDCVHASGHAFNDEQRQMIELCRPRFFVPIHGEFRHLVRHAHLAEEVGLPRENIAVVDDGNPIEIVRECQTVRMHHGQPVETGYVFVDGKGIGDVGELVLRDRRVLGETGMVMCVVILGDRGNLVAGPEILTRGVIRADAGQELLDRAITEVRTALDSGDGCLTVPDCTERVFQTLRRFFRRELARRPLILPVVMAI